MLKRMSKATSLLVAVAAIISIVPASAADYKKIDSQEGIVYNAVAYKDGKFYIDGEVNNQDDGAYYLANGKYNNLSDVDSGSSVEAYGSKYLNVQAGDYFVDLDNGSVTDDSIKDNAKDDTASALRKNVKKDTDGRYTVADSQTIKTLTGKELTGNKFTDLWYGVTYAADEATNGNATSLNVYTDAKGKYIDADYNLGLIKVTTNNGSTEKSVAVSNTNDKYDGAGGTKTVTASVAVDGINEKVIGQDANYIYRTAKVTITATAGTITKINGKAISAPVFSTPGTAQTTFTVIQKISKAQASDNINGAKYAKSVTTYVISKDNGDAIDENHSLLSKYTVSNGKLINYTVGASSVQIETIVLSSKNGYYYTDINDKANEDATIVDTDTNGNIWRLMGGYIYKWNNDEDWTKVYKVDGSFNKMSVYDDNNIVAWNKNDEVYSVIGGQATTTPTTPVVNKGWVKTNTGWTFYNATDAQVKGQWVNDGGVWYMIKVDGIMATGWYNDNGTWYYLNASGAMLANTIVDGYKLGASGAWIK